MLALINPNTEIIQKIKLKANIEERIIMLKDQVQKEKREKIFGIKKQVVYDDDFEKPESYYVNMKEVINKARFINKNESNY